MYLNTFVKLACFPEHFRLTLTWDVFKSYNSTDAAILSNGLTLTWDVFKW